MMPSLKLLLTALATSMPALALQAQDTHPTEESVATAVAARVIPRGTVLSKDDIIGGPGASAVEGWVARRVIHVGEILRAPAISEPQLVRAGESVEILIERGTITLTVTGTTLTSASLGDTVLVRLDAKRRLAAIVSASGRVTAIIPE